MVVDPIVECSDGGEDNFKGSCGSGRSRREPQNFEVTTLVVDLNNKEVIVGGPGALSVWLKMGQSGTLVASVFTEGGGPEGKLEGPLA